jgi:hypothetical protein
MQCPAETPRSQNPGSGTRLALVALLAGILLVPGGDAFARSFQPDLGAFLVTCLPGARNCDQMDVSGFEDFAGQLASAVMPRFPGPIGSLGGQGFEVAYTVGLSELDRGHDAFSADAVTGRPGVFSDTGHVMTVGQLQVRKGLPASFRLGGSLTQVFNSSLWDVGLQLAYTPLEGIRNAPDLGIELQGGTVLGHGDLIVVHAGAALILSKSFGVAGLFTLAPYGGYQFVFVSASTHLTSGYLMDQTTPTLFAFDPRNIFLHRLVFGLESVASWVVVGAEMTIQVPTARRTYAFKLGARF